MKSPLPTIVCIFQLCATPLLYGEGKNTTVKHTCCIKKKKKPKEIQPFHSHQLMAVYRQQRQHLHVPEIAVSSSVATIASLLSHPSVF